MANRDGAYAPCARRRVNGHKERVSHLAVLEATGREVAPDEVVHHINEDTADNNIENLQVMTRVDHCKLHNPRDASRFGVSAAEDKNLWNKLYRREMANAAGIAPRVIKVTKTIYEDILDLLSRGMSQCSIARQYDLDQSTVSRIKSGERHQRYVDK